MASNRITPRRAGIKTHRNYTVDELSRALGAAPITIRRWLKAGLPNVNDQKPALIAGAHLIEFLDSRKAPRQHCQPHECYCVKCKGPRVPAERMAEYVPLSVTTGNLRGLCPDCATLMHKRTSKASLADLGAYLDLTVVQATLPIRGRETPCTNDHFRKDSNDHA